VSEEKNYVAGAPAEVNKPRHYTTGKIEVIDIIEDQNLNFRLGNVVKYICRAEHKGQKLKDLQKALWYLTREIKAEEGEQDAAKSTAQGLERMISKAKKKERTVNQNAGNPR
jgi:hypothetical protein